MVARTLLGISPGTRIVGLAVIKKGELVEWSVKTFKEKWSKDKERAILASIERLCEDYGVDTISFKKVDPLRSSPELDRLQAAITKLAERMQIEAVQYSLSDLDYDVRTGAKQTKGDLSEHVTTRHPEFKDEYLREKRKLEQSRQARTNRREYYTKMFEAIAMAERGREL